MRREQTIKRMLAIGFGLIGLMLVIVGVFNYAGVERIVGHGREVIAGNKLDNELAQREVDHLMWAHKVRDYLRAYLVSGQPPANLGVELDPRKCGFGQWFYGEGRQQTEVLIPSLAPLIQQLEEPHRRLHAAAGTLQQATREEDGRLRSNQIYDEEVATSLARVQSLLREVRKEAKNHLMTDEAMLTAAQRVRWGAGLAAAAMLVLALLAGHLINRKLAAVLGAIGSQMADSAKQVAATSCQVAAGSMGLADRASQQAATLEETSASLEEISAMTKQNSDNAGQADSLMREAGEIVKKAEISIVELTASMKAIIQASAETQKIVKTIDEIAFQTNLLALNAAVEAARAGEAGAGFAVVADEVRNLAMRAAEAARNTSVMIDDTVLKIGEGSRVVERASVSFGEIAANTARTGSLVSEIASASTEQSQGISQLNQAMSNMDQAVQSNAVNAEESATAAEELSSMAQQTEELVGELNALLGHRRRPSTPCRVPRSATPSGSGRNAPPRALAAPPPAKRGPARPAAPASRPGGKGNAAEMIPFDDEFENF